MRSTALLLSLAALLSAADWPVPGADAAGTRYSKLKQITKANVHRLQLAWRYDTNDSYKGSELQCNPIVIGGVIYAATPRLRIVALDGATGKEIWSERIGGNYSASPIFANGHAYFFNEEGKTTVLAPGREFKKVAENKLDSGFMASPAVTGNALILRTKTHLYRIE